MSRCGVVIANIHAVKDLKIGRKGCRRETTAFTCNDGAVMSESDTWTLLEKIAAGFATLPQVTAVERAWE